MAYDPPNQNDFSVQVNNGDIPGYSHEYTIGYKIGLSTSYELVWTGSGVMSDPVGAESYEVVSDAANDTAAGTGAQSVSITTLDADGYIQNNVVELNGTTPVAVPGTHTFPRSLTVASAGSSNENEGAITLRVVGGDTRSHILEGENNCLSATYKVPTGKEFHIIGLDYHTGGVDKKVTIKSQVKTPGSNVWVTTSILPTLQQSFATQFKISAKWQAGSCIRYLAKIESGSASSDDVAIILLGYEVDA